MIPNGVGRPASTRTSCNRPVGNRSRIPFSEGLSGSHSVQDPVCRRARIHLLRTPPRPRLSGATIVQTTTSLWQEDLLGNQSGVDLSSLQWRVLPPEHEHKPDSCPIEEQRQQSDRRNEKGEATGVWQFLAAPGDRVANHVSLVEVLSPVVSDPVVLVPVVVPVLGPMLPSQASTAI